MTRRALAGCFSAFWLLAASAAAQAPPADGPSAGPDFWIVGGLSAQGRLNLRAEPGSQAPVLARLANGSRLRNLGCRDVEEQRWCRVEGPEAAGWVLARFLRDASSAGAQPASRATPSGAAASASPMRPFDAMGTLPCALIPGQPTRDCAFGVHRTGPGTASILVSGPAGLTRWLYFEAGTPVRSDGPGGFLVERIGDLFLIRAGAERFEVPLAVAAGG